MRLVSSGICNFHSLILPSNNADHWWWASDGQHENQTESRRPVHVPCSGSQRLLHTLFLRLATCMALNCNCVNMAFSLLIIPLLIFGFPYFSLPALAASKWPVEVKIGKASVSIDVRELAVIGRHSQGM